MQEQKVLVVYYSSSGNTRKVAQALAGKLNADLEEIRPVQRVDADIKGKGSRNFGNMGRLVFAGKLKRTAALQENEHDPADYDLVVVGTPVYANTLPPEPRTYLTQHKGQFKSVAFFCTGEDPNNAHIFDLMIDACGQAPIVSQPFHGPTVMEGNFMPDVERFASTLHSG
jgi:flavodoxin